jgi:TonB family protein
MKKMKRLFLFIFFAMILINISIFILSSFSNPQISPPSLFFIFFATFFAIWIFFSLLFFSKLLSLYKEIVKTKEETTDTIQIRETVRFDESSPPPPALMKIKRFFFATFFAIFFAIWIFFNLLFLSFFSKLLSLHKEIVETKEETADTIQIRETVRFDESSPPPSVPTQTVFELYELDEPPQPLVQVQPEYPEEARKAGLEGKVIVVAVVDENGDVIEAYIHQSTNPIFNDAALEAARKMKFKPGRLKDTPVKVKVLIPFLFKPPK